MQVSTTFRRAFLHLMLRGLNGARSKGGGAAAAAATSIRERKELIKISADAAMAVARGRRAGWSRALLLAAAGPSSTETDKKPQYEPKRKVRPPTTSRKILRRSLRSCSRWSTRTRSAKNNAAAVAASVVARRMTKTRTQLLRKLVPGGESLSSSLSLLSETVDYVIHLRAQVELMQCLAKALGASNLKSQMSVDQFKKVKVCGLEDGAN